MQQFLYNLATDKYQGFLAAIFRPFLFLLSVLYGLVVSILIFFYRAKPYRLNCRVISVGNITLGGTGKTSLVEFIARYLKQQGYKVAVLSRGYKRKITNYQLPITNYETMGDEPYMLSKNLGDIPVIVDANRIRGAKKAIKDYSADTVILDDGFQQWKIKKDLEIVTIDATNPFGNRKLLPRGILREPLFSLKRADIFVITKTNLSSGAGKIKDFLSRVNPAAEIFAAIHQAQGFYELGKPDELLNTQILHAKAVAVFSGIADPDSFENLIKGLGIGIGLSFRFRDHYNYTQADLDRIIKSCKEKNISTVITTEKDAARLYSPQCPAVHSPHFLVLRIKLIIQDEEKFHRRLLKLYSF